MAPRPSYSGSTYNGAETNGCLEDQENLKPFKQRKNFETRKREVENIKKKFPTKIPVVVERYQRETCLPLMDKTKFLIPLDLTMMNFAIIVKNRLRVPSNRAFYFVINNQSIASTSKTVSEVYNEHHDEDGFLYMTYASQEMFGCRLAGVSGRLNGSLCLDDEPSLAGGEAN